MSVTAGTYTFGSGGAYSTFKALLDDWTGDLTGDVTFLQVGDSDNDGIKVQGQKRANGRSITIRGNTPHYGSTQKGHCLKVGGLALDFCNNNSSNPPPVLLLEDIYCLCTNNYPSPNGAGAAFECINSFSGPGTNNIRAKNSIFVGPDYAALFTSAGSSDASNFGVIQLSGCKFVSNKYCLVLKSIASNPYLIRFSVYVENNAFYLMGTAAAAFANGRAIGLWSASSFWPMNVQHIVNNTFYLANPTLQAAFAGSGSSGIGNASTARFSNNAVNGIAQDVITFPSAFYRSDMAVPLDLQSITNTDFGFLNTNSASNLFSAGAAPTVPFNPYTSSPNLIGVYFTPPIVGVPGSSLQTHAPAVSGIGFLAPYKSRLLPNASASIAHARILNAYRDAEGARKFHEIIRSAP